MSSSHLIRLGKINGKNGILEAMKHNQRVIQSERGAGKNIDPTRIHLNYCLTPKRTPEDIHRYTKAAMVLAGIETPRKNGVMGVEVVFSLPIIWHEKDSTPFFRDCYDWVQATFQGELLSFDVHLDESMPHAHAVILPLVNGKMQGSDMVGGTGNLKRLINLFYVEIASHYGFTKKTNARLNKTDKEKLESEVLKRLKSDPVMVSAIWPIVRDFVGKDPLLFAEILSIGSPDRSM